MSPAGIPMFYGAKKEETAIAEVGAHAAPKEEQVGARDPQKPDHVTLGQFILSSDVMVIDFTELPEVPSIFDSNLGSYRREIKFLHEFVEKLGAPVAEEDAAIDYVPTQVLTEFFLKVFKSARGQSPVGIVYSSAVHQGGVSLVLDIPNECCVDNQEAVAERPSLVLDAETVTTLRISTEQRSAAECECATVPLNESAPE